MATESFFSNASLAYLASAGAGKDGKAYSIKPTDGTGDFTFSRGSNLAATRVGADGLIEKGRENLALYSNDFSQWSTNVTTLTSSQTGYDGSSDAWLLTKSGANGFVYRGVSQSGIQTISVYAKANTNSWMQIYVVGTSNIRTYFDLGNGTLGAYAFNVIDRSIEDVGNGWYRCSVVFSNSTSQVRFFVSDGNNDDTGTSGSILIQDAQLEIGLAATDYIETGATTGKAGLLEDEPRFDYSGGATCPSLLLEPSRTNLVDYSEYFGDSSWTKGNLTLEANSIVSPEGVQNAYKIENTSTVGNHFIRDVITSTIGSSYALSVFLKKGTKDVVSIGDGFNANVLANFDLTNGTATDVSGTDSSIEAIGNDGWYRCSVNTIPTTTTLGLMLFSGTTYAGTDTSGYFYAYGAQTEIGSYPTSYIPNHSGGSVTRGAETLPLDSASSYRFQGLGDGESGTIVLKTKQMTDEGSRFNFIGTGGSGNWFWLSTSIYIRTSSGHVIFNGAPNYLSFLGSNVSIGVRKNLNNLSVFVNGSLIETKDIGTDFITWANVIATHQNAQLVNQFLEFDTALSDADCITLTT